MFGTQSRGRRRSSLPAALVGVLDLFVNDAELVDRSDDVETGIGLGRELIQTAVVRLRCCILGIATATAAAVAGSFGRDH